ncbi:hypothetical protein BGX38DRAFT_433582 [Terfezia claveryi]|nr:hypothetical protein BGX38DRAFT_433582 [Terfezia claveryi]
MLLPCGCTRRSTRGSDSLARNMKGRPMPQMTISLAAHSRSGFEMTAQQCLLKRHFYEAPQNLKRGRTANAVPLSTGGSGQKSPSIPPRSNSQLVRSTKRLVGDCGGSGEPESNRTSHHYNPPPSNLKPKILGRSYVCFSSMEETACHEVQELFHERLLPYHSGRTQKNPNPKISSHSGGASPTWTMHDRNFPRKRNTSALISTIRNAVTIIPTIVPSGGN